jgi:hypothetical protein
MADCEHYKDDQGQREFLARFRPERRNGMKLECMEKPMRTRKPVP